MSETRKTPRKATEVERRKINRLLDEHVKRISGTEDAPGECEFLNDMSDAKIAGIVSPALSPSSVANIRLQIFGKLHKEDPEASKTAALRAEIAAQFEDRMNADKVRIDGLEERLKQMEGVILDLAVKHNRHITYEYFHDERWQPTENERLLVSTAWERRHGEEVGK